MKNDNVVMYDAFLWNWSKNVICDDGILIPSYINEAINNKIWQPIVEGWVTLNTLIPKFWGCVKLINWTFIEICKPWNNVAHKL